MDPDGKPNMSTADSIQNKTLHGRWTCTLVACVCFFLHVDVSSAEIFESEYAFSIDEEDAAVKIGGRSLQENFSSGAAQCAAAKDVRRLVVPTRLKGKPVTSLGPFSFEAYSSVTNVVVPDSVGWIDARAFDGCLALESIEVAPGNPRYLSEGGCLYGESGRYLIKVPPQNRAEDVFRGTNVLWLGDRALAGNCAVRELIVPQQVQSVGEAAFADCPSLSHITFRNPQTELSACSFRGCTSLREVVLPHGLRTLGFLAFEGCRSLETIEIPPRVEQIEAGAFRQCSGLRRIRIPDSVQFLDASAFRGCLSLRSVEAAENHPVYASMKGLLYTRDISTLVCTPGCFDETVCVLPEGLKTISPWTFCEVRGLHTVVVPSTVSVISEMSFDGPGDLRRIEVESGNPRYTSRDGILCSQSGVVLRCPSGCFVGKGIVPEGVSTIGPGAFRDCANLTEIEMPGSVTNICRYAFARTALTNVVFSEGLVALEPFSFAGCDQLVSMRFPSTLRSCGADVFSFCPSLTNVTVDAANPVFTCENGMFRSGGDVIRVFPPGPEELCFPEGTTGIGSCADLTRTRRVVLPPSVTYISHDAFKGALNVKEVVVKGDLMTGLLWWRFPPGCVVYVDWRCRKWGKLRTLLQPSEGACCGILGLDNVRFEGLDKYPLP